MAQGPGEEQFWKGTREQIDTLLYGGRSSPRFTQDSPVLPDVWMKYAEAPNEPHELLLTPVQDTQVGSVSAGQLSRVLKACLALPQGRLPPGPPRLYNGLGRLQPIDRTGAPVV